jgi:hypothetical protein
VRGRVRMNGHCLMPMPHMVICVVLAASLSGLPSEHRAIIRGDRKHGRSRDAPEGHSPVDVASKRQAAHGRTGSGVCQEGGRAERISAGVTHMKELWPGCYHAPAGERDFRNDPTARQCRATYRREGIPSIANVHDSFNCLAVSGSALSQDHSGTVSYVAGDRCAR